MPLLLKIKLAFFNDESNLLNLFQLINELFLANGIKSRRKGEKTSLDIIEAVLETFIVEKGVALNIKLLVNNVEFIPYIGIIFKHNSNLLYFYILHIYKEYNT